MSRRGKTLTQKEIELLRAEIDKTGEVALAERAGVNAGSLVRACAGLTCYPATLFVIRLALEQSNAPQR